MLMKKTPKKSVEIFSRFVSRVNGKFFCGLLIFTALVLCSEFPVLLKVSGQEVVKPNSEQAENDDQKVLNEIRAAKTFIENEEWEKARVKLSETIGGFSHNRYLDMAYYWLAYSLFQQKKFSEAEQIIADLEREFPDSAWLDESKSLIVEIKSKTSQQTALVNEELPDGETEAKAFAIQNLLETARPKGVAVIDEILSSQSKASDNLKESVLILLIDDKSDWATDKFIQILKTEKSESLLKQSLIGLGKRDEKKTFPVLLEFLRQNANESLIDAALFAVSNTGKDTSLAALADLAKNGNDYDLRQKSIIWIGESGSNKAAAELKSIYGFLAENGLKEQIQISLSEIDTPDSIQILIDLIEGETDKSLVENGLELLEQKADPIVLRYLEKKARDKN